MNVSFSYFIEQKQNNYSVQLKPLFVQKVLSKRKYFLMVRHLIERILLHSYLYENTMLRYYITMLLLLHYNIINLTLHC